MIRKKVCMLGGYAVGKTSLVSRFVKSLFSEDYQTSVGVKIDSKDVDVDGRGVKLMLWDIHGEDDFQKVRDTYFRGASGLMLVADGTRRATVATALELLTRARNVAGEVPALLMLNKHDLTEEWQITDEDLEPASGLELVETSAKTGARVEEAFRNLAAGMLGGSPS